MVYEQTKQWEIVIESENKTMNISLIYCNFFQFTGLTCKFE
jgi:hypothetical protein